MFTVIEIDLDWTRHAACAGEADLFTRDELEPAEVAIAQAICETCPVVTRCYQLWVNEGEPGFGVWGARSRIKHSGRTSREEDAATAQERGLHLYVEASVSSRDEGGLRVNGRGHGDLQEVRVAV